MTWYIQTYICMYCCWVASVVSDSAQPQRRQPPRLPRPWDSPGKNAGVGCHFLLQYMYVHTRSNKQLFDDNNPVTPCSLHSGASPSSPPPTQIAFKLPNLEILILSVLPPPFFPLWKAVQMLNSSSYSFIFTGKILVCCPLENPLSIYICLFES